MPDLLLRRVEDLLVRADALLAENGPEQERLAALFRGCEAIPVEELPLEFAARWKKLSHLLGALHGMILAAAIGARFQHADLPRLDQAHAHVLDVTRNACTEALADVKQRLAER